MERIVAFPLAEMFRINENPGRGQKKTDTVVREGRAAAEQRGA